MSVIVARALPDARDGLKPVHRRILFAQRGLNNTYNRPYLKCARIVGDVIGKYHPHGDSAGLRRARPHGPGLLDALHARRRPGQLRLGRRRSAGGHALHRVPDEQARLASCSRTSTRRPSTGSRTTTTRSSSRRSCRRRFRTCSSTARSGIAVGMATNIPPHNLGEVIDGVLALIADPKLSDDELIKLIPGPDFPTGGVIQGRNGILSRVQDRPRHDQSCAASRTSRRSARIATAIVVTELPFMVNKARWIETTADAGPRQEARGHLRHPRRVRSHRHARRVRAQARRRRQGRPQQPVQVHGAADVVLGQHARDRRRPPGAAVAAPRAAGLHRSPPRGRHAPHAVRSARGARRAARSSRASGSR